ncbi:MAG TPA: methionine gamma-lyase family protein [Candidatus Faecicola pullistercoris]|nr:methionine gamma-lyase family protein [Candidatus Faecicola pullistercoris]
MEFLQKNIEIVENAHKKSLKLFSQIDKIALINQKKVLDAFRKNAVQARHFYGTTGYGYDDIGRDTLCRVFADVFGAEDAVVSPLIANGTHALSLALFAVLRPGDTFISVSGKPYDTLDEVISGENIGSLRDFKVNFSSIELEKNGKIAADKTVSSVKKLKPKLVFIQRSRGYSQRDALSVADIARAADKIKNANPETLIMVDNCYGEFVEAHEPTEFGADLIVGSLIKNAGGGFAPTGGYIAGKKDLISLVAGRLTAPSLGNEVGSCVSGYLPYYQGLFMAPVTVANALKSSVLFGRIYGDLGYKTLPAAGKPCNDIIRSIVFNDKDKLIKFCQAIQQASPIDSNVTPEPWDMPGYNDKVIMAAGAFVQGSSIELSADSPIRPPYIAYLQGGLTYEHAKIAALYTLEKLNV